MQGMAYHGLHEAMRKKMELPSTLAVGEVKTLLEQLAILAKALVGPRLDEVGVRHMA